MRRNFSAALLLCCLLAVPAHAGQITLSWTASAGAIGYRLYQSTDYGNTWLLVADLNSQSLPTSTPIDAPDGQLVPFRVSAYDANSETMQYIEGAWYDSALLPGTPGRCPRWPRRG